MEDGTKCIEAVFKAKDVKTVIDVYNKWTPTYDEELQPKRYGGPPTLAKTMMKYINNGTHVLDVAAGTGLLVKELRKLGFKGTLDGLDPAKEFAEKAVEERLYENYFYDYITEEPCSIISDTYDHVACVGGIVPNHIHYKAVPELLRMCKKGGYVFIGMRHAFIRSDGEYSGMRDYIAELTSSRVCDVTETFTFDNYFCEHEGVVFVIQKL